MLKTSTAKLIILFTMILFSGNLMAQDVISNSSDDTKFNQSINMCPIAVAFNMYSFNYEYLVAKRHGLVARFEYAPLSEKYSGEKVKADDIGFILSYRYHFSPQMNSIFVSAFARYGVYDGTGTSNSTDFDFTITDLLIGANVGKRWVWDNGFNIVFALGYGISMNDTETKPSNSDIKSTLNKFKDEDTVLSPMFGELSIGYAF